MSELSSSQRSQLKVFSWTGAALLTGSLLLINFIFSYVPLRFDLSQGSVYSISRGTKDVLKKIDDTMIVRVMFSSELPPQFKINEKYVRDLLLEYKRASHGKIRIEYVDPGKSPSDRQTAMEQGVGPVQLDMIERDRREVKECFMGLSFLYGDKKEAIPLVQNTVGLEYEITQRIKKLVMPGDMKIGIISNGDALGLTSDPIKELSTVLQQLFKIQSMDLTKDEIPTDLKVVWLLGLEKELEPAVINKLRAWIANGGTVGLILDHRTVNLQSFSSTEYKTGLDDLLREWGVSYPSGVVVDPRRADRIQIQSQQGMFRMVNIVEYPYFPVIVDMNRKHPATKDIDNVTFPFFSPVIVEKELPGLTYTSLGKTSNDSWLDASPAMMNPLKDHRAPPNSLKGPFNMGLVIEGKLGEGATKPGRVILLGTSRFIRSDYPAKQTNYNMFLNLVEWAGQDEALLSIRSKGVNVKPIKKVSDGIRIFVKYILILALPLLSIVLGLFVWQREKNRRAWLALEYTNA